MPKQLKLTKNEVYDAAHALRQDVKRMQRCCTKLNDDIALLEMTMINKNEVYRLSIEEFEAWKADYDTIDAIKKDRDNYLIRISRNRKLYQRMLDFADSVNSQVESYESQTEEVQESQETQKTQVYNSVIDEDSDESNF